MDADGFIDANRTVLDEGHGWERRFVDRVLRRVDGLDFGTVRAQVPFTGNDGRARRIDFTIEEPSGVRIALEVDGYDKTGTGRGMTRPEFLDWFRRELAIVTSGWRLLRFANGLVEREPDVCARSIRRTLELERAIATELAGTRTEAREAIARMRKAELRAAEAERRLAEAIQAREAATAGPRRGQADAAVERERAASAARQRELAAGSSAAAARLLPAADAQDLERVEAARHSALRAPEDELEALALSNRATLKENRGMKLIAGAFAVVAVCAVVIVALITGRRDGRAQQSGQTSASAQSACADAIPWNQAADHVGESATVTGPVVSATYRAQTNSKPTFLNVGRPFGDSSGFVVVVWGRNRSKFPSAPERTYDDKTIAVTGRVVEFRGVPQIEANTPSQIERC